MIGHRVALRPRSLLETGDLTLAFMRLHRRPFVLLMPWVLVPGLVAWLLHARLGWDPQSALGVEYLVISLTGGVYTPLCGDLMLRSTTSLRSVQRRFLAGLPVYLVSRLAAWIGMAMVWWLGFPYSYVVFLPEASLLERGSLGTSFARSGALARATPGRAVGYAVACLLLTLFAAVGAELVHMSIRELFGLRVSGFLHWDQNITWAMFLGAAAIQPYLAALRFLLYIDCRTRREGWDLQVQFGALVNVAASPLRHPARSEAA